MSDCSDLDEDERAMKRKQRQEAKSRKVLSKEEAANKNIYADDPNKLDIIMNLNSLKLLAISKQIEFYPNEEVDLTQFVDIMKSVLADTKLSNRDDFIQSLVDLFYRCNKNSGQTIKFEDLTSYLIEHEIQQFTSQATGMNTNYTENTDIVDKISHNSNIEKIFYFEEIDKVLLYAQGQEIIRIYDASKMRQDAKDATITCPSKILAIEYIPDKKAIAVSLSDRSILFYDASNKFKIMQKRLNVPSTQKCLAYIKRKSCLFSAGIDGAIFAWDLTKLFSLEQSRHDSYSYNNENTSKDKQAEALRHKKKTEYISYISEKTPWFVGDTI